MLARATGKHRPGGDPVDPLSCDLRAVILRSAHIRDYKSATDTGEIPIDESVTCLVGKNESGKTAVLEALYRLNPMPTGHPTDFAPLRDFPRSRFARERDSVPDIEPIIAKFELDDADVAALETAVGRGVIDGREITVSKNYENTLLWDFAANEAPAVQHLLAQHGVDPAVVGSPTTLSDLRSGTDALDAEAVPAAAALGAALSSFDLDAAIIDVLRPRLPRFYYFDEYSELPGRLSIPRLQATPEGELDPSHRTALALLRLAGVESEEFTRDDYEARRASLEAASSEITSEVFEFWSQNKDLRVLFDADFATPPDPPDEPPYLEIRIENRRHFITLNFAERSAGFQWFFSFLAAFSEFRKNPNVALLLDEPAMGLHAAAQGDLLRYIEERLALEHSVIYTTHSPFMVDAKKIDRVRTVEDRDDEGTVVSVDVLGTSRDTVFPLQAALGYELAQTLFVGPNILLVEGPADFIYLTVLSELLASDNRDGLAEGWTITPVGGLDKLPTFIALLNTQVNIAVVLDEAAGGNQRINSLIERGVIAAKNVVSLATISGTAEADIEDLFKDTFYLKLLRDSTAAAVRKQDLPRGNRIVKRIEQAIGSSFNHYTPARHLLENQATLAPQIEADTRDRFEKLFQTINPLLET